MFKRICIKDWRQFKEIDLEFHDHLTVITGANGAGKTTILNLLSEYVGWEPQFVSSFDYVSDDEHKYGNGHIPGEPRLFIRQFEPEGRYKRENTDLIGELEFQDGKIVDIGIPSSICGGVYSFICNREDKIKGVYINSHRPIFPYKCLTSIPTSISTREEIYNQYNEFYKTYIYDTYRDTETLSATSLIKRTLASLAIFGYGNGAVTPNERAKSLFEGYCGVLKKVLPPKLGFQTIKVAIPEVIMCTETGEFPLDAVSGGISSIIDITWKLFMYANSDEHFVALIDEPENHLHPELQKSFLGNLIEAFPNVQFIVATHNPFMITSQKDSYVYVLNYDDEQRVFAYKLDQINKAGTSNEVLCEVLGMDSTMPIWAENRLERIVGTYIDERITDQVLKDLKKDLEEIGLGNNMPQTIAMIMDKRNDTNN